MASFYDTLAVPPTATAEQIKKAFRKMALQWHPDRHSEKGAAAVAAATRKMADIVAAHEILRDAVKRQQYDVKLQELRSARPATQGAGMNTAGRGGSSSTRDKGRSSGAGSGQSSRPSSSSSSASLQALEAELSRQRAQQDAYMRAQMDAMHQKMTADLHAQTQSWANLQLYMQRQTGGADADCDFDSAFSTAAVAAQMQDINDRNDRSVQQHRQRLAAESDEDDREEQEHAEAMRRIEQERVRKDRLYEQELKQQQEQQQRQLQQQQQAFASASASAQQPQYSDRAQQPPQFAYRTDQWGRPMHEFASDPRAGPYGYPGPEADRFAPHQQQARGGPDFYAHDRHERERQHAQARAAERVRETQRDAQVKHQQIKGQQQHQPLQSSPSHSASGGSNGHPSESSVGHSASVAPAPSSSPPADAATGSAASGPLHCQPDPVAAPGESDLAMAMRLQYAERIWAESVDRQAAAAEQQLQQQGEKAARAGAAGGVQDINYLIALLPSHRFQPLKRPLDCSVCLEPLKQDEQVLTLPCLHLFHSTCIVPWLKRLGTCPIDKQPIHTHPLSAARAGPNAC